MKNLLWITLSLVAGSVAGHATANMWSLPPTSDSRVSPLEDHQPASVDPPPPSPPVPDGASEADKARVARAPSLAEFLASSMVEGPGTTHRGAAVLEGRVVDGDGRGRAGVTVVAEPLISWFEAPTTEDMIREYRRRRAGTRTTRTAPDGSFLLDGLDAKTSYVVALPDNPWSSTESRHRSRIARIGDYVQLQGPLAVMPGQLGRIEVQVELEGERVDRARIEVLRADSTPGSPVHVWPRPWLRDDPEISLSVSSPMTARAKAHGVFASPPVRFDPDSPSAVALRLEAATSVHGRFAKPKGQLRWTRAGAGPEEWQGILHHPKTGAFRLVGLEPGSYRIQAHQNDDSVIQEWQIEVQTGFQRLTLERDEEPMNADFVVEVVGSDGTPIEGLTVVIVKTRLSGVGGRHVPTGPVRVDGGRYWIRVDDGEQRRQILSGEVAEMSLSVHVPGVGKASTSFSPEKWREEHRIAVPAYGEIVVEIEDYIGSGYEGQLRVRIEGPESTRSHRPERIPDALGRGRRDELEPGAYSIVATVEGVEYHRETVQLRGGEERVRVPLPEYCSVTVRFPPELHGQNLKLSQGQKSVATEQVTGEHTWTLTRADYSIRIRGETMTFRVTANESLSFEPTRYQHARLRFLRRDGYLAGLGLERDDLVIAVDGAPFAESNPARMVKERLEANGRLRLRVLRDQEELDFDIDRGDLGEERIVLRGELGP